MQEGQAVAQDILRYQGLFKGFRVHQDKVSAFLIRIGVFLILGGQAFHRIGGAPALVLLGAGLHIAHFHLNHRGTLAGDHDVLLQDGVALAFKFNDHTGAHLVGLHLRHGDTCILAVETGPARTGWHVSLGIGGGAGRGKHWHLPPICHAGKPI